RKNSGYAGLAAAQTFSGHAVKSLYANVATDTRAPARTQVAENTRQLTHREIDSIALAVPADRLRSRTSSRFRPPTQGPGAKSSFHSRQMPLHDTLVLYR